MSQYKTGSSGWWAVMGAVGALVVVCIVGYVFLYFKNTAAQSAQSVQSAPSADVEALVANALATAAARATPTSAPILMTSAPEVDLTASLNEITGKVEFKQAGDSAFSPAAAGVKLKIGGQVQTGVDGKVRLDLSSGTIIRVRPSSIFTLAVNEKADKGLATRIKLEIGWIFVILTGGKLEVETPAGVAAVRGSFMSFRYDPVARIFSLTCLEGNCSVTDNTGAITNFSNGQSVTVSLNSNGQWVVSGVTPMTDVDFQNWLIYGLNSPAPSNLTVPIIQGFGTTNGQIPLSVVVNAGQTAGAGGVCEFTAGTGNISTTQLQVISAASGLPNYISSVGCTITHNPAPNPSAICFASINPTSKIYFNNNGNWEPLATSVVGGKACTSDRTSRSGDYRIGVAP